MPDYSEFTAAEVAAYWPLNVPWWRKVIGNTVYAKRIQWNDRTFGIINVTEGSAQDGAYQDWLADEIKILQCVNDDNSNGNDLGCTCTVGINWQTENDLNATTSTTILRLSAFGATDTDTILNVGTGNTESSDAVLTVTGPATTGALEDIKLELNVDVSGSSGITTVSLLDQRYWMLHAGMS